MAYSVTESIRLNWFTMRKRKLPLINSLNAVLFISLKLESEIRSDSPLSRGPFGKIFFCLLDRLIGLTAPYVITLHHVFLPSSAFSFIYFPQTRVHACFCVTLALTWIILSIISSCCYCTVS